MTIEGTKILGEGDAVMALLKHQRDEYGVETQPPTRFFDGRP